MENEEYISICYIFDFNSPQEKKYELQIRKNDLSYVSSEFKDLPEWTKLDYHKCEHCPLNSDEHPYCPMAANISQVADHFIDEKSYRETKVGVITEERTYLKRVPLQDALFSIFGLIMATCACPHMNFLRPMARFHLPFATSAETTMRSISMFFLRKYFQGKKTGEFKYNLDELETSYENVNKVNKGICNRFQNTATGDADANAVVILDTFAQLLTGELSGDYSELEDLFNPKSGAVRY